jgi:hypothetical protein
MSGILRLELNLDLELVTITNVELFIVSAFSQSQQEAATAMTFDSYLIPKGYKLLHSLAIP